MKKFIAGVGAAGLMSGALVAVTGGTAHAVCGDDYTGPCPPTSINARVPASVKTRTAPRIRVNITTAANKVPKGRIFIRTKRVRKGMDRTINRWYAGGARTYKAPRVRSRGKYRIMITFVPRGEMRADREVYRVRVRR